MSPLPKDFDVSNFKDKIINLIAKKLARTANLFNHLRYLLLSLSVSSL